MNKNEILLAAFTIALFIVMYLLFESVLVYIVISAVLAILGSPLVKLLQRIKLGKFSINKGLASFITLISFYGIITTSLLIVMPFLIEEAKVLSTINPNKLLTATATPIEKIETLIFEYTDQQLSITTYTRDKIISILNIGNVSTWLNAISSFTGNILLSFFAISFISFFFLKDGRLFFEKVKSLVPPSYRQESSKVLPKIRSKMTRYFIGLCIEVLIIFVLMSIGLSIVGVKYFLIMATVAALFNIIPYLGPIIGILFGIIVTCVSHCTGTEECLVTLFPLLGKTLLVYLAVQLLDNIVLQPFIYGKSIDAHPLEIFLVVIISGNIWGVTGLILAIPVWSVIKIILTEIRKHSQLLENIYESKKE